MAIFWILLAKIMPLYLMIGLGYIAARFLGAQKETVAKLLIYVITPVVVFYGTAFARLDAGNLLLPVIFFAVACILNQVFLQIGKRLYGKDPAKNILAFAAGAANAGYFGLPVTLALFDGPVFSMAVLLVLGSVLYDNTLGFYVAANGNCNSRESFLKVVKLPALYAFVAGFAVSVAGFDLGAVIPTLDYFKATYTLLGMMLIGMGLAGVSFKAIDYRFLSLVFLAKFILWPAIFTALIFIDSHFSHIYSADAYRVMILMSVVPVAANTVAYATEFKNCPDKAAVVVFLSALFALFYIPLVAGLFLGA